LLARFAVFARGASLEQVEAVCGPAEDVGGDIVDRLDYLADQSLIRRLPDFDEPRFLMLQTIREFGAERLEESGEAQTIRDRHAAAFLALAQQAQPNLFGRERKAWLDRLETEQDNFRAALDWTLSRGDARSAMLLGGSLWRYWQMRGHIHEGRSRMQQILAMTGSHDYVEERLVALEAAGGLAYWQADMASAQVLYDECLDLTRRVGDKRRLANAIYNAAFPRVVNRTAIAEPRALLEEALPLFKEIGDQSGVARALWALGNSYYFGADYEQSRQLLEQSQALSRSIDDRFALGWALHTHGLVALKTGNLETARKDFLEAIDIFTDANDVSGIVLQLDNLSQVIRTAGDPLKATRLAGAAKAHQGRTGTSLGWLLSEQEGRTGREGLSEQEAARVWEEGQALSLEEALEEAIALARAANVQRVARDA
jgi:tetratricopeptide (TPR) repeat protein